MKINQDDPQFLEAAIKRLQKNIAYLENSEVSRQERQDLIATYNDQIKRYNQKLLSFSKDL